MSEKIGVRELARLAKVSVGTVDRALHNRPEVSERTRARILRLAEQHGYEPNLTARALSVSRSNIRIGVVIPREIRHFYDQVRDGILEEAGRLAHLGVEVDYKPISSLGVGEVQAVRKMLTGGVKALILTPGDPGRVAPLIDEAEKQRNVRVVCVSSDDSQSSRSTAISVEPATNGRLAGELMAKFVPGASKVAIVTGMLATEDHARKAEGFQEVFPRECAGGTVEALVEGRENERETYQKCRALLGAHPGLAGLYVATANCLPVCKALEESGLAGRVRVIATDLYRDLVPHFHNGTIAAAIYQRPYRQGQIAVRLLGDYFFQGKNLPRVRYLNPTIAMRSNLHLFRETAPVVR